MTPPDAHQTLLETLKAAVGLLQLPADAPLHRDVQTVCQQLVSPNFRIVVFGPFNYGKSTLLNALLGERALPIDLVPTTGAAITVRYGTEVRSRIQLRNGTTLEESGTEILQQFAILDQQRRMREDVAAVEVLCPHPWLKTGVELVDLPGTDDQEAQDSLVKNQLLTADLVVQVLDGRKLMTLGEREHLRDWLLDRGIETVVFVVNFLNLLDLEEQKQVCHRLRFVAESFRSRLPVGISNLYRVDALPALRARLKGDMAAAQMAGLPLLESALQAIAQSQSQSVDNRLPRIQTIAHQVQQLLQQRLDLVTVEIREIEGKRQQKIQIKQQAQTLLSNGFTKSVTEFRDWLSVSHLLNRYQPAAAQALQIGQFRAWESGEFKKAAIDHQQAVAKWVQQACDFFDRPRPHQLLVSFPPAPSVIVPDLPPPPSKSAGKLDDLAPTALATGLGWVLGGPVGGAILGAGSYLLNKALEGGDPPATQPVSVNPPTYLYQDAARDYLVQFSSLNLAALKQYELLAERVLQYHPRDEVAPITEQHHQRNLLQMIHEQLESTLRSLH